MHILPNDEIHQTYLPIKLCARIACVACVLT